ncbi:MurR/RpiR family transcriptional regulator [Achromobacter aloeverae]|uniref:MurR/RpiR family transcriptional regulator n=1 Tax=Achromobacter aloeverae TaxID=1750518 RepID=A0A4Q1HRT2_9BURK|nr:MurR/RpiR family transcriptional regulator [Achromobacter aloeverae]RXN93371.1 MurR/RpiR family transcriptional regulator [Achromobacter aloeverae]
MAKATLDERVAARLARLSPAEQRVARFFQEHREEVMVNSAAALARRTHTSDATVVRTTQALGYAGLDALRQGLAQELRARHTLPRRLTQTVEQIGHDIETAFDRTLRIQTEALASLRQAIKLPDFRDAVARLRQASRVVIFGLGPSNAVARYFSVQLNRFGYACLCLEKTGLLFADELHGLRAGDLLVVLAYDRVYAELDVLLSEARRRQLPVILVTDTLKDQLAARVDLVLPVPRGKADFLSLHTATLALLEMLLVGLATQDAPRILDSLERLDTLRVAMSANAPLSDLRLGRPKVG